MQKIIYLVIIIIGASATQMSLQYTRGRGLPAS
jgi:hypothetical protein